MLELKERMNLNSSSAPASYRSWYFPTWSHAQSRGLAYHATWGLLCRGNDFFLLRTPGKWDSWNDVLEFPHLSLLFHCCLACQCKWKHQPTLMLELYSFVNYNHMLTININFGKINKSILWESIGIFKKRILFVNCKRCKHLFYQ